MAHKRAVIKRAAKPVAKRHGRPFVVYFKIDQAARLNLVARERRVPKSELVRLAVDRLLDQLASGQMDLPLGI